MATCSIKSPCREIHNLLRRFGQEIGSFQCCGEFPCDYAFRNIRFVSKLVNVDTVDDVEKSIKKINKNNLPIDQDRQSLDLVFHEDPFFCPEIDTEIRQPCKVRSCAYWTDHSWTRNCIWYYRLNWHRDILENSDIAFLLDLPSNSVVKRIHSIIAQLRRSFLRSATASERSAPVASYKEKVSCTGCGSEIIDDENTYYKKGYPYCSRNCVALKPPIEARIEYDFGLPVKRVLEICIDSFVGKRPICHALNITTRQLDQICENNKVILHPDA